MTTNAATLAFLQGSIELPKQRIAEFANELKSNPSYAMMWSRQAFTAAAELHVAKQALKLLKEGAELEPVINYVQSLALCILSTSSNPTSDMFEREVQQAACKLLKELQRFQAAQGGVL